MLRFSLLKRLVRRDVLGVIDNCATSITSRAELRLLAIRGRLFFDLGFEVGKLGVGKVFEIHLPTPNFPT